MAHTDASSTQVIALNHPMFMWSEDNVAKFWLSPVRLVSSGGFPRVEIARIQRLVKDRQDGLMEAWNAYCQHG